MTATDAAYLAGIVDGEGHIRISLQPRNVRVSVSNTCPGLIEWMLSITGGGTIGQQETVTRRACYTWNVGNWQDCIALLAQIEPFMIIKRERAQEALTLLRDWYH